MLTKVVISALLMANTTEAARLRNKTQLESELQTRQAVLCDSNIIRAGEVMTFPEDFSSIAYDDTAVVNNQLSGNYVGDMKAKLNAWVSPNEIAPIPSLWGSKGVQPHGINQGILGDCWFLAAAAALAEWPDRVKSLFKQTEMPTDGIYDIDFYYKGERVTVRINDKLPVQQMTGVNYLLNSRQSRWDAFWFVLLEKAFAKLNFNYATLNGGWGVESLRALTGAPVSSHTPRELQPDSLFFLIADANTKEYAMTAGCAYEGYGLITGHLYSVLGVWILSTGERLIQMRNPWGVEKYTGPWNDNDTRWTPALKEEVGLVQEDDGIFYMELEGFQHVMSSLEIAMIDDWKVSYHQQKDHAGQRFNFNLHNPADQEVVFAVDHGVKRMLPEGCEQPVYYNIYMDSKSTGERILGPVAVNPELGYGQAIEYNLPKGDYNFFVINWDDANFKADFKILTYAKNEALTGDVTPRATDAAGNQDTTDPEPEPQPEVPIEEDGVVDNIDMAMEMGLATQSTHRKGALYGWFDTATHTGHMKVEKKKDNKNLWFKFDFFTTDAQIPWHETDTNIPEWYYNMKGWYIQEGDHQFYRFKVLCPSGINPCYFSMPTISYWGDVWLGRK